MGALRSTPRWSMPISRTDRPSRSPWMAMKSWQPWPGPPCRNSNAGAAEAPLMSV
jgi:hypothetical protein